MCVCVPSKYIVRHIFPLYFLCVNVVHFGRPSPSRSVSQNGCGSRGTHTHTHTQMIDDHFHFVLGFVCAGYWARFVLDALTRSRLGIFGAHMNERAHTLAKIAQRLQMHTRFWSREHTHTLNSILSINHFICILCLWDYTYFVMFSPPCTHLSACVRACVCAHALSVGKC